ncbi:MAG TPA: glycosyltransferase, partial [Syntrophomonas sp.]|nr:glycosyltransferase [Syntrophomonas sp.]
MADERNRVLMVSPFKHSQRGNSITSLRLKTGLEKRGFVIDLVSLEDSNALLQIQKMLAENNYSLIHAFHARHWGKMLEEMPSLQDLPILLTTTGTDLHFDLQRNDPLVKKGLISAQKIVIFHQGFIDLIRGPYPEIGPRLRVIPQGIYLQNVSRETFLPLDFNQDDFVFYFPSGLRPVKNFELTLNGLEMFKPRYPQLKLVIIGAIIDHQYGGQILERIQSLPWVTYGGEIPHAGVRSVIKSCHAVINSSHFEGQPQGALEAMSQGLPCILTAVSGNLNIIENSLEGFYVHNEQELAEAAGFLMDNPHITK